jgi:hypothetical protein
VGAAGTLFKLLLDQYQAQQKDTRLERDRRATIRVIRFQFYCAQQVLKRALASGLWWEGPDELIVGEPGQDLKLLADLLPEDEWRIYTSGWRRLRECANLRRPTVKANATSHQMSTPPTTGRLKIEISELQEILGTFVTVDDARHRLEPYVQDITTGKINLDRIRLSPTEKINHWHAMSGTE